MRKAAMAKGVQFVEQPVTELQMLLGQGTKVMQPSGTSFAPKNNPHKPMVKQGVPIFRFIFF